jgi:beta-lactamase regulating signal transducer with metallopeptidase domain/outer membrane biosynthesis protein TonB
MKPLTLWMMEYAVNAAWQVPLLFATAWLLVRLTRRAGAAFEHRVWVSALLLEALLPACPLRPAALLRALQAFVAAHSAGHAAERATVTVAMGPGHALGGLAIAPMWLTAIAVAYAATILFFSARLAHGLYRTYSLRRRARDFAFTGAAAWSVDRCARLFRVPNAAFATSAEIAGPITLGTLRRTLLLPMNWSEALPGDDLDAALAHEFAHMRRYDFARNLAYEVLTLPMAFHPLLWLTRSRVAETRELVCDAMAAKAMLGREEYARSLLRLAALVTQPSPNRAPQAIGIFDGNHFANFERRIMNLTGRQTELNSTQRIGLAALGVTLGLTACTSALAMRMQIATPAAQNTASAQTTQTPATQTSATATSTMKNVTIIKSDAPQAFVLSTPRSSATPKSHFLVEVPDAPAGAITRVRVLTPVDQGNGASASPGASQSPGSSEAPREVSANAMAGNILTKVMPVYPPAAKQAKIQGQVVLSAIIGKDGLFKSLQVLSGPDELRASAKEWTYKPYLLNGQPVEVETTISVTYALAE